MSEELPKGWVETSFDSILISITNGIAEAQNKTGLGIPVTRIETISDGKINIKRIGYVADFPKDNAEKYILEKGDILFSHINSPIHLGKTAIVGDLPLTLFHGTNLLLLRTPKLLALPYYFEFYCRYYRDLGEFSKNAQHAVNQSSLNQKKIKSFIVKLPPINEQKRIVAKLDAIMHRIEAVKGRLDKVPGILKHFRQSVLTAAVTGKLTEQWREEHPEVGEWEETQLGDLTELVTKGASPTWQGIKYVERPEVLFVTSENVYTRELKLEQKKYVEFAFNQKQQRSILNKGDLLTNIVGASIGRTAVYNLDSIANVNQAVAIIRLCNNEEIPFYLYYLNCPEYVDKLHKEKVDVARANISLTDLKKMMVPHPPLSEQKEIVRQVDKLFALADKVESHYNKAKAEVDKLSQSVLAKAFRGELVPQDPNDEPAEKLLERIQEEKAKMKATKKKTAKKKNRGKK